MIGCFNCPITANCPITLSDYNCKKRLVKNEAANAPIILEEFVMVIIMVFELSGVQFVWVIT